MNIKNISVIFVLLLCLCISISAISATSDINSTSMSDSFDKISTNGTDTIENEVIPINDSTTNDITNTSESNNSKQNTNSTVVPAKTQTGDNKQKLSKNFN